MLGAPQPFMGASHPLGVMQPLLKAHQLVAGSTTAAAGGTAVAAHSTAARLVG